MIKAEAKITLSFVLRDDDFPEFNVRPLCFINSFAKPFIKTCTFSKLTIDSLYLRLGKVKNIPIHIGSKYISNYTNCNKLKNMILFLFK